MTEAPTFKINRAPVLTLWSAIVAQRLGYEALTLGRAVAGLNGQSKGKRLGIFKPSTDSIRDNQEVQREGEFHVELPHRAMPVVMTPDGIRATAKGKPSSPASVQKYLGSKFGEHLAATENAMAELAKSIPSDELADIAFKLYEQFRPEIPAGAEGWGAAGELDLAVIRKAGGR